MFQDDGDTDKPPSSESFVRLIRAEDAAPAETMVQRLRYTHHAALFRDCFASFSARMEGLERRWVLLTHERQRSAMERNVRRLQIRPNALAEDEQQRNQDWEDFATLVNERLAPKYNSENAPTWEQLRPRPIEEYDPEPFIREPTIVVMQCFQRLLAPSRRSTGQFTSAESAAIRVELEHLQRYLHVFHRDPDLIGFRRGEDQRLVLELAQMVVGMLEDVPEPPIPPVPADPYFAHRVPGQYGRELRSWLEELRLALSAETQGEGAAKRLTEEETRRAAELTSILPPLERAGINMDTPPYDVTAMPENILQGLREVRDAYCYDHRPAEYGEWWPIFWQAGRRAFEILTSATGEDQSRRLSYEAEEGQGEDDDDSYPPGDGFSRRRPRFAEGSPLINGSRTSRQSGRSLGARRRNALGTRQGSPIFRMSPGPPLSGRRPRTSPAATRPPSGAARG